MAGALVTYAELHAHSCFSFREGASTPLELILTARKLGYTALALTDHDSLAGAMEFALEAREWDVRPLIGVELTLRAAGSDSPAAIDDRMHLTLLAETPGGYGQISRLVSYAYLHSRRGDAALDLVSLPMRVKGVVALSGCRRGEVARLAATGAITAACEAADRYASIFGRDCFFIELQQNCVRGDRERNRRLLEVSRRTGLPIVATNNVHYHERERHRLQDVLVAIQHRTTLDASERLRRPSAEFYMKSPEEMARLFDEMPEAVANTVRIAERCHFDLMSDLTYRFPDYSAPDGQTADEFLEGVCFKAAIKYYGGITPTLEEKIRGELRLIQLESQAGFFLRNWALMQYAQERGLPSRGRGSSVGSLVCYLLGLSGIDPIKYDLFSGRFLASANDSAPALHEQ